MKQPLPYRSSAAQSGAALVVTMIVCTVLAVVAVAMMQNTNLDRASARGIANQYRAQLAAEAGLAEAISLLRQNTTGFAYVSGAQPEEEGYRTFIRRLDGSTGSWEFDGEQVWLDSGMAGEDPAEIVLVGTESEPKLTRNAAWKQIAPPPGANPAMAGTTRYAFWVDDASGKQNLAWWGGGTGERGGVTNTENLSLVLPNDTGTEAGPFPASAVNGLRELRSFSSDSFTLADKRFDTRKVDLRLPTVATLNLSDPDALAGNVNSYFFTLQSSSGATTPTGGPKLNLAALRRHINNLNTGQGEDSPRAKLVEELLKEDPEGNESWGGGSLSWLSKSEKYTPTEQKQIVANIIDYLDDDLVPTTDNPDSPSYFGVEYRLDSDGKLRGHPFICHLGFGLQFNISGPTGERPAGTINSTRILCALGIANMWPVAIEKDAYKVSMTVEMKGQVTGNPSSIADYFDPTFNERMSGAEWEGGSSQIGPNSMFLIAGKKDLNLRAMRNFLNGTTGPGLQNIAATFSDVKYAVTKCQLIRIPDDGTEEYVVSVAANLPEVDAEPPTFTLPVPGARMTLTYPTGDPSNELYLSGDPRSAFRKDPFVASGTSYADNLPVPSAAIDIFKSAGDDYDGVQGVPTAFRGLVASALTNHISRISSEGMQSIGELGYIWTGKPWQTVNLTANNNAAPADWNLLDYVSAGLDFGDKIVPVLPLLPASTKAGSTMTGSLLAAGGFNINTRKEPTIAAVVSNAPDLPIGFTSALSTSPSASRPSAYGEIAAVAAETFGGAATKFEREAAQRALANVAVNHSRVFTVHTVGEYRMGDAISRAHLEADVFVGVDPSTGSAMIQVIDQRFR